MNKKICLIILLTFLLTGCYDYKELNTIVLISATEVNKIDDEYIVNAEVINTEAPDKNSKNEAPFIVYTGKGKTLQEAYRKITLSSSRFIYSNHLQLLIINENLAKEDITEIIDFFLRNPSFRTEFYVLIGKDEDILSIRTAIDNISSTSIKKTIDVNKKYSGNVYPVTFNEFVNMIANPNLEVILPTISITGKNNNDENNIKKTEIETKYELNGYSIFKDNKLVEYLTPEESKYYNIIKNKIENTILVYNCDKSKYITLEIIKSSSKIKTNNNKINIEINMNSNVKEISCDINLNNNKEIKKIKKDIENKLNKDLKEFINKIIIKYNTDIFEFKDLIYKKDYKYYKTLNDNYLNDLDIFISSNINIISKGNILEAINEKNN